MKKKRKARPISKAKLREARQIIAQATADFVTGANTGFHLVDVLPFEGRTDGALETLGLRALFLSKGEDKHILDALVSQALGRKIVLRDQSWDWHKPARADQDTRFVQSATVTPKKRKAKPRKRGTPKRRAS